MIIQPGPEQKNAIGAHDPYTYLITGYSLQTIEQEESVKDAFEISSTFTGEIKIDCLADVPIQSYVRVVNALSQSQIFAQPVEFSAGMSQKIIDLSAYPSGYYVVNILTGTEIISKKIYKK